MSIPEPSRGWVITARHLDEARAERDRLLALLRRIQWGGWSSGWRACPDCGAIEPHGHREDCEIARAIGEGT